MCWPVSFLPRRLAEQRKAVWTVPVIAKGDAGETGASAIHCLACSTGGMHSTVSPTTIVLSSRPHQAPSQPLWITAQLTASPHTVHSYSSRMTAPLCLASSCPSGPVPTESPSSSRSCPPGAMRLSHRWRTCELSDSKGRVTGGSGEVVLLLS